MSIIAHRCKCGHTELDHARDFGRCSFTYCACTVTQANVAGPSEVVMTFRGNEAVETPVVPGTKFGSDLGPRITTCGCDECKALYAAQVVA